MLDESFQQHNVTSETKKTEDLENETPPSPLIPPLNEKPEDTGIRPTFMPSLLEGEMLVHPEIDRIIYLDFVTKKKVPGSLFLTNYQFILAVYDMRMLQWQEKFKVPFGCVYFIDKVGGKANPNDYSIHIRCKDSRIVRLDFRARTDIRGKVERLLQQMAFPTPTDLFAFQYKPTNLKVERDGWNIYNIFEETLRLQLPFNRWRISDINFDYSRSHSYPSKVIVPATISDEDLDTVFPFRSKGRIPALTWVHPINRAVITRSSQPLVGLQRARCPADEFLIEQIRSCSTGELLYILDARPKANAMTNQVIRGMGYENELNYSGTKLEFLNIPNIHVMRDSQNKIYQLCQSTVEEERWLTKLDNTHWLDHIRTILVGTQRVVQLLEGGNSVLLHCSDGWDRTAQLSSLAQLLLDGYYRTIAGFEVLVEKEWLSFGHKFQRRLGHGNKNFEDDQRAPIFPQWVDCVYQLIVQFPCAFEFNEKFLLEILDSSYSCRFGTFLFNNERKRQVAKQRTVSLWTYIDANISQYRNVFFMPDLSTLNPACNSTQDLTFWKNYFCRWHKLPKDNILTPELRVEVMQSTIDAANQRIKQLEKELEDCKTKNT